VKGKSKSIILFVLSVCLLVIILSACGSTKINPEDYLTVSYSGMNSKGTANISLDYSSLESAILDDDSSTSGSEIGYLANALKIETAVSVDADNKSDLSNGDEITVTVSCDEDTAKELNFSFSKTTITYTVEGLAEATTVDVFKDIKINVVGYEPYASIDILNNSTDEFLSTVTYTAEPDSDLKNGDTVTITANYSEGLAELHYYVVSEDSMTYTVPDIDGYVTSYDQIDASTLASLDQEAIDFVEAQIINNTSRILSNVIGSVKTINNSGTPKIETVYFLTSKGSSYDTEYANMFIAVCSAEINASIYWSDDYNGIVYFPVFFYDLVDHQGVTEVDLSNRDISGQAKTAAEAYTNCITANKDNFVVEEITPGTQTES